MCAFKMVLYMYKQVFFFKKMFLAYKYVTVCPNLHLKAHTKYLQNSPNNPS